MRFMEWAFGEVDDTKLKIMFRDQRIALQENLNCAKAKERTLLCTTNRLASDLREAESLWDRQRKIVDSLFDDLERFKR